MPPSRYPAAGPQAAADCLLGSDWLSGLPLEPISERRGMNFPDWSDPVTRQRVACREEPTQDKMGRWGGLVVRSECRSEVISKRLLEEDFVLSRATISGLMGLALCRGMSL